MIALTLQAVVSNLLLNKVSHSECACNTSWTTGPHCTAQGKDGFAILCHGHCTCDMEEVITDDMLYYFVG